jgi:hypothetical protein
MIIGDAKPTVPEEEKAPRGAFAPSVSVLIST